MDNWSSSSSSVGRIELFRWARVEQLGKSSSCMCSTCSTNNMKHFAKPIYWRSNLRNIIGGEFGGTKCGERRILGQFELSNCVILELYL